MPADKPKRKLAAILSADAAGYSRLMEEDEAGTLKTLKAHFQVMSSQVENHRGRVVAVHGDSLLAEFDSVVDAVQCAMEIQKEIKARNDDLPEKSRMPFRIGINLGDVIEEGGNVYGDGVNVAARLEGLADPGGICISRSVHDQVKNKLSVGYQSMGAHSVKNIAEPVQVYRIQTEPDAFGKAVGRAWYRLKQWQKVALAIGIALLPVFVGLAVKKYIDQSGSSPGIFAFFTEKTALPLPDKPSIAVLPFENMTGDPKQEYFTDGFTEQIITSLSKISSLFVISRNSSFTYKGKPVKVGKVSKELGVRYVLEGSIQKSGDRVRINAQLIDAISDQHLWAENYDRSMKDIFALQDEITLKILTALQVNLTSGEQARVWAKGTKNLEAYLKVMQARESILVGNAASVARGRQLAEEAIELDPQYAKAFGYIGTSHVMDFLLYSSKSPKESLEQAVEWLQKAVAMDDSLADAHARLAHAYTFVNRHEEAIAEAEKAMAMDPNSAEVHNSACYALRFSGKAAEAVLACKKAIRLEPFAPGNYYGNLGMAYFQNGSDCEEAVKVCGEGLKRAPDSMIVHFMATTVFSACGKEKEARKTAKELLRINPKFSAESFAKRLPQKDQKEKDRIVDALRKAGL
ncbi:MAG: adenylate/guanylate cyclase domain-containing protein [Deltaproteobacteria bacterium]|nr:adenylate/guanylate cyclase domain-containing protein [Candidatus Deferrimicrobium borealis]